MVVLVYSSLENLFGGVYPPLQITAVTKHNENVCVCSSRKLSNSKSGTASVLTSSLKASPR